jgi:hypothetical protein
LEKGIIKFFLCTAWGSGGEVGSTPRASPSSATLPWRQEPHHAEDMYAGEYYERENPDDPIDPDLDLLDAVPDVMSLSMSTQGQGQLWARLDFTVDSGSATSCIPKDFVKPELIKPCKDGPKVYKTASNHSVTVVGYTTPLVKFQNGVTGRWAQEAIVLDSSYEQSWL